jgi:peptide-methionine (S)-S-oxide reductase
MMSRFISVAMLVLAGCSCSGSAQPSSGQTPTSPAAPNAPLATGQAEAIFAGGCFWCMEQPFEVLDGVASVTSGYTGGEVDDPSYEQVSSGDTGHAEAVRIVYDPARVSYERLLEVFFHNVDPTDAGGQFCDRGNQYRTGIFAVGPEQLRLAREAKAEAERTLGQRIVTEIVAAGPFYAAEDYHQDFYRTNPVRYRSYRLGCGRDRRLEELWGDAASH